MQGGRGGLGGGEEEEEEERTPGAQREGSGDRGNSENLGEEKGCIEGEGEGVASKLLTSLYE